MGKQIYVNGNADSLFPQQGSLFLKKSLMTEHGEKVALAQDVLRSVLKPKTGEKLLMMTDLWFDKRDESGSNPYWKERTDIADIWHEAACKLAGEVGFEVLPILTIPYREHPKFPTEGFMGGMHADPKTNVMAADILVCLPVNSFQFIYDELKPGKPEEKKPRALFLPTNSNESFSACLESIEEMDAKAGRLEKALTGATGIEVLFHCQGGSEYALHIDIRGSPWMKDWEMEGSRRKIWLPAGEYFTAPYPGTHESAPSRTKGQWPIYPSNEETYIFHSGNEQYAVLDVEGNRVRNINGNSPLANMARKIMGHMGSNNDNVAEIAFAFNTMARKTEYSQGDNGKMRKTGAELKECEKAEGLHIAFGHNAHFMASHPHLVQGEVHTDIYYNDQTPIVPSAYAVFPGGKKVAIMEKGKYTIF